MRKYLASELGFSLKNRSIYVASLILDGGSSIEDSLAKIEAIL